MLSYDELNQALESSADQKNQLGYHMPRNSDGSVDVDGTVQMKLAQTQVMIDAYNQYMGYSTPQPSQVASAAEHRETQKQAPPAPRDHSISDQRETQNQALKQHMGHSTSAPSQL